MQRPLIRKMVRIKNWLMVAMMLLIIAEFSYILSQVFNFIWAIIGAIFVLIIRLAFYKYQDNKGWQQKLLIGLAIVGILGPVIYFIYRIVFVDSSPLWLSLFLTISFLMPVVILYYVRRSLTQLIENIDVSE